MRSYMFMNDWRFTQLGKGFSTLFSYAAWVSNCRGIDTDTFPNYVTEGAD